MMTVAGAVATKGDIMRGSICWVLGLGGLAAVSVVSVAPGQGQSFEEWLAEDRAAFRDYSETVSRQYEEFVEQERQAYKAFVEAAGCVWGKEDVWVPEPRVWVQYSEDLEERSGVNFEEGGARVQVVVEADSDPQAIEAELAGAVERLALSGTVGPIQMFRRRLFGDKPSGRTDVAAAKEAGQYTVQPGDSLWGLSRKLGVSRSALALANGIGPDDWLKVGQVLRIPGAAAPTPSAPASAPGWKPSAHPLLSGQLRMKSGAPVTSDNAADYAREVVAGGMDVRNVKGGDGKTRRVAGIKLP